jgi:hypothetical protein
MKKERGDYIMFSDEIRKLLDDQLPVKSFTSRSGQERKYVDGEDVKKRLNDAFGHAWSDEVIEVKSLEGGMLVRVELQVPIVNPSSGNVSHVVVHSGFGYAQRKTNIDEGDALKSAHTNAIKSAAKNFGIGLFLDDDSPDTTTEAAPATPSKEVKQTAAPKPKNVAKKVPKPSQLIQPADDFDPFSDINEAAVASSSSSSKTTPTSSSSSAPSQSQMNAIFNMSKSLGVATEEDQRALIKEAFDAKNRNDVVPANFSALSRKQASDVVGYCIEKMNEK